MSWLKSDNDLRNKYSQDISNDDGINNALLEIDGPEVPILDGSALSFVKEILFFCVKNKYKELLLITGKGLHSTSDKDTYISKDFGKLKFSVPEFIRSDLETNKLIVSINEAEVKDGGEGAILIKLKNL